MPYRETQFANDEIYHITLRGLDDRELFLDNNDYYRMIFSIYEFNDTKPVAIRERRKQRLYIKQQILASRPPRSDGRSDGQYPDERERFVDILAFCWMPNHIHLLVRQLRDGGITKFMSKVGVGYAKYFNTKYERKGYVFQNRFNSVHIENDKQLQTVFVYIHTNPIALIEPGWKEKGILIPEKVIKFIENYKWSSYMDYLGNPNFKFVTQRNFLAEVMGGVDGCRQQVKDWVEYKKEIRQFRDLFLE